MFKIITMRNVHKMKIHTAICYMHEKYGIAKTLFEREGFLCLIKLLFIKVRCLINVNVSLEANLEGQEG